MRLPNWVSPEVSAQGGKGRGPLAGRAIHSCWPQGATKARRLGVPAANLATDGPRKPVKTWTDQGSGPALFRQERNPVKTSWIRDQIGVFDQWQVHTPRNTILQAEMQGGCSGSILSESVCPNTSPGSRAAERQYLEGGGWPVISPSKPAPGTRVTIRSPDRSQGRHVPGIRRQGLRDVPE